MEIILSGLGTRGDIHPLVGLAIELKTRGYSVTLLANDYFEDFIKSFNLKFFSISTKEAQFKLFSDDRVWNPKSDINEIDANIYSIPSIKAAYDYVVDLHSKNSNILVISPQLNNGARLAAEKLNLPSVLLSLAPYVIPSIVSPSAPECLAIPKWMHKAFVPIFILCKRTLFKISTYHEDPFKAINKFRINHGMKKFRGEIFHPYNKEYLHIGLFPEWFATRAIDWPKKIKFAGFPLFDGVNISTDVINDVINDFILTNGAPILFTTGTGVYNSQEMFNQGKAICEALGVAGIFVGNQNENDQPLIVNKFLFAKYLNFEKVLPKCLLVVHHGGVGTLAQAVRAGIPQFIRPLVWDQPDNALRVRRLGLGVYSWPENFKVNIVVKVIQSIIENDNLKKNIEIYSSKVKKNDSIKKACDYIVSKIEKKNYKEISNFYFFIKIFKYILSIFYMNRFYLINLHKNFLNVYNEKYNQKRSFAVKEVMNSELLRGVKLDIFKCTSSDIVYSKKPCIIFSHEAKPILIISNKENIFFIREMSGKLSFVSFDAIDRIFSDVVIELNLNKK